MVYIIKTHQEDRASKCCFTPQLAIYKLVAESRTNEPSCCEQWRSRKRSQGVTFILQRHIIPCWGCGYTDCLIAWAESPVPWPSPAESPACTQPSRGTPRGRSVPSQCTTHNFIPKIASTLKHSKKVVYFFLALLYSKTYVFNMS